MIPTLVAALMLGIGNAEMGDTVPGIPDWAQPGMCGPNCLFVLMAIMHDSGSLGAQVCYSDIVNRFSAATLDRGCSLADLQWAASKLGVTLEPRKVSLTEFPELPTPYIAHLDLIDKGGVGHFVTVYKTHREKELTFVCYVDGSSAQLHSIVLAELRDVLSGFVLIPHPASSFLWQLALKLWGLGAGVVCGIMLLLLPGSRVKDGLKQWSLFPVPRT